MGSTFPIQARTLSGLEKLLAQELSALGARNVIPKNRVVFFEGDLSTLYKANLWCRTAIRMLRPLASADTLNEKALYDEVQRIDWSQWMRATGRLAVDAKVYSSFTTHSLYVAQLTKDAIVDQFRDRTRLRPSVDLRSPDLRINVRLHQNRLQIALDSSGDSLHRRGYRLKTGEAPLNEVLAAGIIQLSGWDRKSPLLDPMCGSGTFAIEAALLATNRAPGLMRRQFAFQKWPDFDKRTFDSLVAEAKAAIRPSEVKILGIDNDPTAIRDARENAEWAGVKDAIEFEAEDFFTWDGVPGEPGTLVINPPYDERLKVSDVSELWSRIGEHLVKRYRGWKASLLCGNAEAARALGLKHHRALPLFNGAIECRLFQYQLGEEVSVERPSEIQWKAKAQAFSNRLKKTLKHTGKWARREGISCFRVYDKDIPELPFTIDVYGGQAHFAELPRNQEHSATVHAKYLELMKETAADALGIDPGSVHLKRRTAPIESTEERPVKGEFSEVQEGGHRFLINLTDYVDVGLLLDQRSTRALIEKEAGGKDFLNCYAYTGSLSVYAAAGGAKSTTSVDSSRTYLEWAERNLKLNGFSGAKHRYFRADVMEFLLSTAEKWDLIVMDPPARSTNRVTGQLFDVRKDHAALIGLALKRLRAKGKLYFSTSYQALEIDPSLCAKEITGKLTSPDFSGRPGYRAWVISASAN